MKKKKNTSKVDRRAFLKNTSVATFMAMMGGVELTAAGAAEPSPPAGGAAPLTLIPTVARVNFGVIGAGVWGRKILSTLNLMKNDHQFKNTQVVAVCDHFPAWLNRAKNDMAPDAEPFDDYKKLLAKPEVQAVVVATPTHLHRDIVLDALKAGKHVYCEAPLAHTIADAKDIARAAKAAFKQVFQAGLQERSHPHRIFLSPFIRGAALGRNVFVRAQCHNKTSWARTANTDQRTAELNWRLHQATSTGLMGEACIHRLDAVTWFLGGSHKGGRPGAVTGFSSLILWDADDRDVPDTVQCVFEFPEGRNSGVRFVCDATLCNSFDSEYEMYYGTESAILMQPGSESRESKAWMFQEVDATSLGWEGYARHDSFGAETGISLVANASKQAALTDKGSAVNAAPLKEPIQYALESFTANCGEISGAVESYELANGSDDTSDYRDHLAEERKRTLANFPAAGWEEGLEATVLAIKASEAALSKQKIELKNEFFEL